MSRWRAAGIEYIPELRNLIERSANVFSLWIDLCGQLERAYRCKPCNETLIKGIYGFADWCVQAPRVDVGHDPASAVIVCFYEHVPTLQAAREDMPRWFTYGEVARNRVVFSYFIGDAAFDELVLHMKANRSRYVQRDRVGN